MQPLDLKYKLLREVENELGRERSSDKYAPREIDLDILLYGDSVINENGLVVPDPEIGERAFLAIPLCDLDPELVVPGTGKSIRETALRFPQKSAPMTSFTDEIRKELTNGPQES